MRINFEVLLRSVASRVMIVVALVPALSCGDDDDDTHPLVGTYQLSEAKLTGDVAALGLVAGDDITDLVAAGFFSVAGCSSGSNAAVELEQDFELYFKCLNESTTPVKGGTWGSNAANTELTLNLSAPPFTNAIAVTVVGVSLSGNILSGTINNLPFQISVGGGAPVVVVMSFTIKFTKVG
jgi:hypothetical protein